MLAIGEVFPSSLNVYLSLLSLCCLSDLLKGFKVTGFICAYLVFSLLKNLNVCLLMLW